MTGADGTYRFPLLPPGEYGVKFEAAGFASVEVPSVQIVVTETPVLDRTLSVGSQTQAVTVEGEVETIQTSSSALGMVVGSTAVAALPLSTRNYENLISMTAGAMADVNNAGQVGNGFMVTAVNGGSTSQNNFQMDGAPIDNWGGSNNTGQNIGFFAGIIIPNPDAIQEFKIQSGSYDASYGRNAGANVNVITKSGTNSLHGTAFEFLRNTSLNASEFFYNSSHSAGAPKPVLNQNQFGGMIGGPIKKDKLFFFGSYQETEQKNGLALYGYSVATLPPIPGGNRGTCPTGWTTPTQCDATAQAWITALGAANCPPAAGANSSNGGVARSSATAVQVACTGKNINPVAINILQLPGQFGGYYFPSEAALGLGMPAAGKTATYAFSQPAIYHEHQYVVNWDYVISSKHTLSGRSVNSIDPTKVSFTGLSTGSLPGMPVTLTHADHAAVLKLTSILSSTKVNEVRFSYQRFLEVSQNLGTFTDSQVGITPMSTATNNLTNIIVTGTTAVGASLFYGAPSFADPGNQYQVADDFSWTRGNHSFRTGVSYGRSASTDLSPNAQVGQFTFPTFSDFLIGQSGSANGTGLSNISSIYSLSEELAYNGGLEQTFIVNDWSAYLQDDWKLSPRLTLNLGLRWERFGLPYESHGVESEIWPSLIATQPIPPSTPGSPLGLAGYVVPSNFPFSVPAGVCLCNNNRSASRTSTPNDNFGPRIGFAWRPLPTNRFVVRGGGGIFYDRPGLGNLTHSAVPPPPFASAPALVPDASLANPYVLPATVPGPPGTLGWATRFVNFATNQSSNLSGSGGIEEVYFTPTVYSWNLNTQTEFLPRWVLELGYVGSRGVHNTGNADPINLAPLAGPSNPLSCGYDGNPADCITTNTVANVVARVPYLGYAPVYNGGTPTDEEFRYNALPATLRKQISHGLQVQAAYTWARAFINSWIGNPAATAPGIPPSINVSGLNSAYRPQRMVFNYNWDLPLGTHKGIFGAFANGWTWSGITTIQSGYPLVLTDSRDGTIFNNGGGGPVALATYCPGVTDRDVATTGSMTSRLNTYFNKADFCAPQAVAGGTGYGSNGLGGVRGPGENNWDMSMAKSFKIKESQSLQFRSEFFNTFNHPQFANPGTNAAAGTSLGVISSTIVNPRLIQFALKYSF
jgi:hypothetical protein